MKWVLIRVPGRPSLMGNYVTQRKNKERRGEEGRRVKCRGNKRKVRKMAVVGWIKGEGEEGKSRKNKTRINERIKKKSLRIEGKVKNMKYDIEKHIYDGTSKDFSA